MMSIIGKEIPIIKIEKGCKVYSNVYAIRDIDFELYKGQVHALAGENGAGKTTLVKPLAGAIELTSGRLLFEGVERSFKSPAESLKAGIATVYQSSGLVPTLTVAQNIELGRSKILTGLSSLVIRTQQILTALNFDVDASATVNKLGAGQKQMVEIARAVSWNAKVIIFDEPTASLAPEEKEHFFDIIRNLQKKNIGVIYISHALEESLEIADRITVLRDGQLVITDKAESFTRESLIKAMVGRDVAKTHYVRLKQSDKIKSKKRKKVLSVQNIIQGTVVKNLSFSLYEGEIVGMAGLVGSGRTEVAKVITGIVKRQFLYGGMIYFNGKPIRYRTPKEAIDDGIVYITEDRKVNGYFETMTVTNNIYMGYLATRMQRSFLVSSKMAENVGEYWRNRMNIRTLDKSAKLIELSGGNQQKVVIAKSLVQKPKVVIFDEPTAGVDVGAIEEIHKFIIELAKDGIAILLISSYLPELLSISDRILVTRLGQIVQELNSEEATEEKIMFAAIH
jgi:ABC-type sugar transport system ATPase subunit